MDNVVNEKTESDLFHFSEEETRKRAVQSVGAILFDRNETNIEPLNSITDDFHTKKCLGVILGTACGDILGANVEMMSADNITEQYGIVKNFLHTPRRPQGTYTDDTEMTLALASSIVAKGYVDLDHCALSYAESYTELPTRGYGSAAVEVLKAIHGGADPRKTGTMVHPEGSYANGSVMRIAPVGLAFRHSSDEVLRDAVKAAVWCTHTHPEAIDCAFLQAKAVAILCEVVDPQSYDIVELVSKLRELATTELIQEKLRVILDSHNKDVSDVDLLQSICEANQWGKIFQIRASEALACSLWSLLRYGKNPEEAVIKSVNWGGDADTIGAITGALVGALHGIDWIPTRWYNKIEDETKGRTYMIKVSKELAALDLFSNNK